MGGLVYPWNDSSFDTVRFPHQARALVWAKLEEIGVNVKAIKKKPDPRVISWVTEIMQGISYPDSGRDPSWVLVLGNQYWVMEELLSYLMGTYALSTTGSVDIVDSDRVASFLQEWKDDLWELREAAEYRALLVWKDLNRGHSKQVPDASNAIRRLLEKRNVRNKATVFSALYEGDYRKDPVPDIRERVSRLLGPGNSSWILDRSQIFSITETEITMNVKELT